MTDTLAHSQDSVRLWLSRQESLEAGMAIVDSWLHEGNTTGATLALTDIAQNYDLSIKQQLEYNYFLTLKNVQCVYDLDSVGLVLIVDLAENSRRIAGLQAKNILNEGFAYDYYDEAILPTIENQNRIGFGDKNGQEEHKVIAFPNPASEMVQFHYKVKKEYANMSIRIWDSTGKLIDELTIQESKTGFLSWDTQEVETGFYFYSICTNENVLASGKLVVSR